MTTSSTTESVMVETMHAPGEQPEAGLTPGEAPAGATPPGAPPAATPAGETPPGASPAEAPAGTAASRRDMALPKGTMLGGHALEGVLGQGAFGITYLARDPALRTHVAIKEFFPQDYARRDPDGTVRPADPRHEAFFNAAREAFLAEARTLARFKHPHIVRILSFFEANNTACFVMDFEQGQSLQRLLKQRGVLVPAEVNALLGPLLDGLEALHALDFIHRDIKPGNIYLRLDGQPVLLDFGAACQTMRPADSLCPVVTDGYAPPEQYEDDMERQGPWTDLHALAVVALRCLVNVRPPSAPDRREALRATGRDPMQDLLAQLPEDTPPGLRAVIREGVRLEPEDRPRAVAEWRRLAAAAAGSPSGDPEGESALLLPRVLLLTALDEHALEDAHALRQCQAVAATRLTQGEEALALLAREPLDGCVVDELLEDMSGMEFLRRRRRLLPAAATPVLHAGLTVTPETRLEAASLGVLAVLPRPLEAEALRSALGLAQALRRHRAEEEAILTQARAVLTRGAPDQARTMLDDWKPLVAVGEEEKRATPNIKGPALFMLGQGCRSLLRGDLEEAGLALAMARKTVMLEAEARMLRAEASRLAGRVSEFAAQAQAAHEVHLLLERLDAVAGELGEVLLTDARRPLPLNTAGVRLRKRGEVDAALLAYALALDLLPHDPRQHFNLAKALAHGGRHKEAFEMIRKSLALDPDFGEAESLFRKITGKAWRTGRTPRARALPGPHQPLLDV